MVTMKVSVDTDVDIDIYLEDFYDEMDCWDKEKMAQWLARDGFIDVSENLEEFIDNYNPSFEEQQLLDCVKKLVSPLASSRLSQEDIQIIKLITDKL